jgi:hypothetical protein
VSEQFNPKDVVKNLSKTSTQLYLQVKDRVRWFREENPKGKIKAEVLVLDIERGYASVKATVTNEAGGEADNYGSAWRELLLDRAKQQRRPDAEMIAGDFLEWATTSAIGRALAGLGYGTEEALDFSMSAPADAPHNTTQEQQRAEQPPERRAPREAPPTAPTPIRAASPPAGAVSESAGVAFKRAASTAGLSEDEQKALIKQTYPGRGFSTLTADEWHALELKCRAMYSDVPAPEEAIF